MFDNTFLKRLSYFLLLLPFALTTMNASAAQPTSSAPANRWLFDVGAGGAIPAGGTSSYVHPGFNITAGGGYRLSGSLSVWLDVGLAINGMKQIVLQREQQPLGHFFFPTFAVDPTYSFAPHGRWRSYVSGGAGMSVKEVAFSQPSSPYHYTFGDHALVQASKSSLQPMVDFGGGIGYHLHSQGRTSMFLESRYMRLFTPAGQFPGFEVSGTNLIPLTLGVRW